MTPVFAVHRRDKNNVCAKWRTALFTGLPRCVRNETERYEKVAARTKSAGDTCTKNDCHCEE